MFRLSSLRFKLSRLWTSVIWFIKRESYNDPIWGPQPTRLEYIEALWWNRKRRLLRKYMHIWVDQMVSYRDYRILLARMEREEDEMRAMIREMTDVRL